MVTVIPRDKLHLHWINEYREHKSGGVGFRLCSGNVLLLRHVHTSRFHIPVLQNTQPFPPSEEMSQQPRHCMSRLNFRVQQLGLLNTLILPWPRGVGGTEIDIWATERWTVKGRTHLNSKNIGSECSCNKNCGRDKCTPGLSFCLTFLFFPGFQLERSYMISLTLETRDTFCWNNTSENYSFTQLLHSPPVEDF